MIVAYDDGSPVTPDEQQHIDDLADEALKKHIGDVATSN